MLLLSTTSVTKRRNNDLLFYRGRENVLHSTTMVIEHFFVFLIRGRGQNTRLVFPPNRANTSRVSSVERVIFDFRYENVGNDSTFRRGKNHSTSPNAVCFSVVRFRLITLNAVFIRTRYIVLHTRTNNSECRTSVRSVGKSQRPHVKMVGDAGKRRITRKNPSPLPLPRYD